MVEFLPSVEQQALLDAAASFLKREMSIERFRHGTRDQATESSKRWLQYAELGWFGVAVPADMDGAGYSLVEETLLFREFGRHLLTPTLVAATLSARIALKIGNVALHNRILKGEIRLALAHWIGPGGIAADRTGAYHLIDSGDAELIVMMDERGVALVDRDQFVDNAPIVSLDPTISLERARWPGGPVVASIGEADDPSYLHAAVLLSAMMVGCAEATRDMAVNYAKIRNAFGQPIGSFQAIKHQCADMAVRAEAAWCQTVLAALALNCRRSDASFHADAARLLAADGAIQNAERNIHIHGAMGFTEECDAHLYLKRSHVLDRLLLSAGSTCRRILGVSLSY